MHPKKWPKGHKHEVEAVKRQQTIAKNMENMPKLLAEAKVRFRASNVICTSPSLCGAIYLSDMVGFACMQERKKLPDDIPPADRFFMSRKQLYNKYVRARQKQK